MVVLRRAPGRPGKNEPAAPTRRVGVRVPLELLDSLERIAAAQGVSRHATIRNALVAYAQQNDPSKAPK